MPTLEDLIQNKETYPDSTKVTLAEGVETTLGELRKNMMLERDYRRKTAELAERRRAFEAEMAEWEAARVQAEAKLTELAKQLVARNPEASRDEVTEMLAHDPVARKLTEYIAGLANKISEIDRKLEDAHQRQRMYEEAYIADQHRRVLAFLKQHDPELNEAELIQFARANYIPRLDMAYRLLTEEKRVKEAVEKAKQEAREEAYKKAKEELLQPTLAPRRPVTASPEAAKSLEEAAEHALRDPEIVTLLTGGG